MDPINRLPPLNAAVEKKGVTHRGNLQGAFRGVKGVLFQAPRYI